VVCNPSALAGSKRYSAGAPAIAQYDINGLSADQYVQHDTSGTRDLQVVQRNGVTVMTWTRDASNGDPTDAQVSLTSKTGVVFFTGASNTLGGAPATSGSVLLPLQPPVTRSVKFSSSFSMEWVLSTDSVKITVTLKGRQGWYVTTVRSSGVVGRRTIALLLLLLLWLMSPSSSSSMLQGRRRLAQGQRCGNGWHRRRGRKVAAHADRGGVSHHR
jgi:hypothetical protein